MLRAVLLIEVTFVTVWLYSHPSKSYSKYPPFSNPSKKPILHIACGAHRVLSNVCSVLFQSPAVFSPDSRAAKSGLWRLLSRLHQAGLTLLAMAEASGFPRPRPEPDSQAPAHIPRLCSCSWNLAQHIVSLQREKSLTLSKIDVNTSTVWLSFTHSSVK